MPPTLASCGLAAAFKRIGRTAGVWTCDSGQRQSERKRGSIQPSCQTFFATHPRAFPRGLLKGMFPRGPMKKKTTCSGSELEIILRLLSPARCDCVNQQPISLHDQDVFTCFTNTSRPSRRPVASNPDSRGHEEAPPHNHQTAGPRALQTAAQVGA